MKEPVEYNGVYFLADDTCLPLGVSLVIRPIFYENRVEWDDTGPRGSMIAYSKPPEDLPDPSERSLHHFVIIDQDSKIFHFEPLTLESYNKYFKRFVAGSPTFPNQDALQTYYLTCDFQAY